MPFASLVFKEGTTSIPLQTLRMQHTGRLMIRRSSQEEKKVVDMQQLCSSLSTQKLTRGRLAPPTCGERRIRRAAAVCCAARRRAPRGQRSVAAGGGKAFLDSSNVGLRPIKQRAELLGRIHIGWAPARIHARVRGLYIALSDDWPKKQQAQVVLTQPFRSTVSWLPH